MSGWCLWQLNKLNWFLWQAGCLSLGTALALVLWTMVAWWAPAAGGGKLLWMFTTVGAEELRAQLEKGAVDPNARGQGGKTILHEAAIADDLDAVLVRPCWGRLPASPLTPSCCGPAPAASCWR